MFRSTMEPDIPAAISHLSGLGTDELKELLNNDEKFEEMIKDNKQLSELESEKEIFMVKNRSLAEFNLAKQPDLEEGRRELQNLSEEGNRLCLLVQEKLDIIKTKSSDMSPDTALDLLQAAAAEMEEDSEEVAKKFLTGETEVDEFLEQFLTRRKMMHERKVKVEKMKELMRKPSSNPITQPFGNLGYPTSNYQGVPYPMGIGSIPMPVPMSTSKPF